MTLDSLITDHSNVFSDLKLHMPELNRYGFLFNFKKQCYIIDLLQIEDSVITLTPSGKPYQLDQEPSLWNSDFHLTLTMMLLMAGKEYDNIPWNNVYRPIRSTRDVTELLGAADEFEFPAFEMPSTDFAIVKSNLQKASLNLQDSIVRGSCEYIIIDEATINWLKKPGPTREYSSSYRFQFLYNPETYDSNNTEAAKQDGLFQPITKESVAESYIELAHKIMETFNLTESELLDVAKMVTSPPSSPRKLPKVLSFSNPDF